MDFVVIQDFKSPYVVSTGRPDKPTAIKTKQFKKGEIINGEMKHANGAPAFVLWKNVVVVPLNCIKSVVTKEINTTTQATSSAEGSQTSTEAAKPKETVVKLSAEDTKKKYLDAMIIGALAGFIGVKLAEKQGWLPTIEQKNKLIGIGLGALAGAYIVYRFKK